ncbi:MAG: sulfatase-like hydrolase/transferase [Proteobacteria bacterium]|nr:sulfatase-like hydrolase/transferase [Pseudomonadota bacterium]
MNKNISFLLFIAVIAAAVFWQDRGFDTTVLAAEDRNASTDDQPFFWQTNPNPSRPASESNQPNIVLILADDLGFNDITFYGGGIAGGTVPTPNIDSIATAGIHFPRAYAGNATCAPSRAALLTGRYATRVGFEFTPTGPNFAGRNIPNYPLPSQLGLPSEELTLPELLREKDYHSIALGKWHLGSTAGSVPNDQGFDEFLGMIGGAGLYLDEDDPNVVNSKQEFDPIDRSLWRMLSFNATYNKGERFKPPTHMTDFLSREAVKAIEINRDRPFFMYLAYNAPHTPLQAEKADYDALRHIQDHTERTYAAMLRGLDRGIGQVLTALQENGLEENTIVIFTSDNGGAGYVGLPDLNKPYRGWKISFFEGGIHVPYFIKWPQQIPAGSQYDSPVAHIDVFSTVLAAAGIDLPNDRIIDGVDILTPALQEDQPALSRPLFWRSGGYKVVQSDGWKLQVQEQNGKRWLYNLNDDPTEQVNQIDSQPDRAELLSQILYELNDDMVEPLWPTTSESSIPIDYTINNIPDGEYEFILWNN